MGIKKTRSNSNTEYTVTYTGMRGVAFDGADGGNKRYRFSYLENMYKDYHGGRAGTIESVPGYRLVTSLGQRINGIYSQRSETGKRFMIVHAGDGLYKFELLKSSAGISGLKKLAELKNGKSAAFNSGHDLFVLDGESIVRLRSDGTSDTVSDETAAAPYVPTTFINGEEHEQRNLLTNKFRERYVITSAKDSATYTDGLNFAVTSEIDLTAAVTGIDSSVGGYVYVPSYTEINGREYKVTEIAEDAFRANQRITSIILSDTIETIGHRAFLSATALKEVITRDSLMYIGEMAFADCSQLESVYLGSGIKIIGMDAFILCKKLSEINYAADEETFSTIILRQDLSIYTINYSSFSYGIRVEIPIFSPAESLSNVTLNGVTVAEYETKQKDGVITSLLIDRNYASELDGKEIVIEGIASTTRFTRHSVGTDFIEENGNAITGYEAITRCTVCESFDGRVFLTGNPALPSTVFYSQRDSTGKNNPLYFGALNYFNDGVGSFGIGSLLATGDSLAVFKKGDDGGGSIYYHKPTETGIDLLPKIYPVSYIHSGIYAKGPSISFYDDPIFISGLGVTALDKKAINLERSIAIRSSNINTRLLCEDLEKVMLAKWCGYLVVLAGNHMYLADSRAMFISDKGHSEYEWYYVTGIESHSMSQPVYRYSELKVNGIHNHPVPHSKASPPITNISFDGQTYQTAYYDSKACLVYRSGEYEGGTPHPATALGTYEDNLLFFGTEDGRIFQFNNDLRGMPPPQVEGLPDFDADQYAAKYGRLIHPYFYSQNGHAPTYALKTIDDDGGIPHLTKSTVKGSLTVNLKSHAKSVVTIETGTEKEGFCEVADIKAPLFDFRDFDFEALSFSNDETMALPIKDKSKNWIKKSVTIYSDSYGSPFAFESLTYRFKIKGKIKY